MWEQDSLVILTIGTNKTLLCFLFIAFPLCQSEAKKHSWTVTENTDKAIIQISALPRWSMKCQNVPVAPSTPF